MSKSWVALDKKLATTFSKIRRPYSEIEAMFSYSLDVNCGKVRSMRSYSRMWSWSRSKTVLFLKKHNKKETVKRQQRDSEETVYSLILLDIDNTKRHKRDSKETVKRHKYKEQRTKNKITTIKTIPKKEKYGTFENVLLTEKDYQKIIDRFNGSAEEKINNLSEYVESTGKKYKSHYATILAWARREKKATKQFTPKRRHTTIDAIQEWADDEAGSFDNTIDQGNSNNADNTLGLPFPE